MAKLKAFPKQILVTRENEGQGEDEYLQVHQDGVAEEAEHGQKVAVYVLRETLTKNVVSTLV